jgi:hypothetical protein
MRKLQLINPADLRINQYKEEIMCCLLGSVDVLTIFQGLRVIKTVVGMKGTKRFKNKN